MLYLAEVKNQNKIGFVGGGYKTEFKLLASQSSDQTWTSLSGNDEITVDVINDSISKGALYILNLDQAQELQSDPELAGARVVNYLRQLSRILERSKELEVEIEDWQDSLRLQGEQIALRQDELDKQQLVISQQQKELAELEEEKAKLSGAWEQVRKEEARSKESKAKVQKLLKTFDPKSVQPANISDLLTTINQQKQFINNYLQQLESDKNSLPARQEELKRKQAQLDEYRQELEDKQNQLQEMLVTAQSSERVLQEKEERLNYFNLQLKSLHNLKEEASILGDHDPDTIIDLNELENMPLGDLENIVNTLQQETSKLVDFVNLQEEELSLQANEVKELEEKMNQVGEVEKFSLESELADAEEAKKLLNETLVGQRKTLKKQQKTLNQHFKILTRRKGVGDIDFSEMINIKPLLTEISNQRQYIFKQQDNLKSEIEKLHSSQTQINKQLSQLQQEYQEQQSRVKEKEQELLQIYQQMTETECNISLLEQIVEPLQQQSKTLSDNAQNFQPGNIDISSLVNQLQSML